MLRYEDPGQTVKRIYFTQPDNLMKLIVSLNPTVNEHEDRIYNLEHSLCLLIYYWFMRVNEAEHVFYVGGLITSFSCHLLLTLAPLAE